MSQMFTRLIFGSKLESAQAFQDWVFEEVLPAIRKTGSYTATLNNEQQQIIKELVLQKAHQNNQHYSHIYRQFYHRFAIPRYQELPASQFEAAVDFLKGNARQDEPAFLNDKEKFEHANQWLRVAQHRYYELKQLAEQLEKITAGISSVRINLYDPITSAKDLTQPWEKHHKGKKLDAENIIKQQDQRRT